MKKLKRYDVARCENNGGDYCLSSDVEALEKENEELREKLETAGILARVVDEYSETLAILAKGDGHFMSVEELGELLDEAGCEIEIENKPTEGEMKLTKQTSEYTKEELECIIETQKHIETVRKLMTLVTRCLENRAIVHDESKFSDEELASFALVTPKLKSTTYGSDEYKKYFEQIRPAIDHHQKSNRHHPEYYINGFREMTLIDLIEMLCDWMASSRRHDDGNIFKSIAINQKRFGYGKEIYDLLTCTAIRLSSIESLGVDYDKS